MPTELLLHELTHVFVNSAGFGLVSFSLLDGVEAFSYPPTMCSDLGCAADHVLDSVPYALRTPAQDAGLEGDGSTESNKREIVANFIQNAALNKLTIPAEFTPLLQQAIALNMARNIAPADMTILGTPLTGTTLIQTPIFVSATAGDNENLEYFVPANTALLAYKRTDDAARLFVGVAVVREGVIIPDVYNYVWLNLANTDFAVEVISTLDTALAQTFKLFNGQLSYENL